MCVRIRRPIHCLWECNMEVCRRQWVAPYNTNHAFIVRSNMSASWYLPKGAKKKYVHTESYAEMFISGLFIIAKSENSQAAPRLVNKLSRQWNIISSNQK